MTSVIVGTIYIHSILVLRCGVVVLQSFGVFKPELIFRFQDLDPDVSD